MKLLVGIALAALLLTACPVRAAWWQPAVTETWDYTLSTGPNLSLHVAMQDFDGFDNGASVVAQIHANGAKAVCYMDAGTWENWRPDASQFPASVKGKGNGWPGEKWLDIRQTALLQPLMAARADRCRSEGFDAIDWDNVDGYTNATGFPLKAADQITYNTLLASLAHDRGLAVLLKNDTAQVAQLAPAFDGAVVEQCAQYKECGKYSPFVTAGKPVFEVEYKALCPAPSYRFNAIQKHKSLDTYRVVCPS